LLFDLIDKMIEKNIEKRISVKNILKHPYFFSKEEGLNILQKFSNIIQNNKNKNAKKKMIKSFQTKFELIVNEKSWRNKVEMIEKKLNANNLIKSSEEKMKKKFNLYSILDLVRFFRNIISHFDNYDFTLIELYDNINLVFPKLFYFVYFYFFDNEEIILKSVNEKILINYDDENNEVEDDENLNVENDEEIDENYFGINFNNNFKNDNYYY
jgi:serine/threonine protein kinase